MKFCILMAFRERDPWLALHLPVYLSVAALVGVGFVFLDTGVTEASVETLRELADRAGLKEHVDYHVYRRPFDYHFDVQQNLMIELAEALGYDDAYKADLDELLFPAHLAQMPALFEAGYKLLLQPRYGFMADRLHYVPVHPYFPNWTTRAFVLGHGLRYHNRLHEELNYEALGWRWPASVVDAPQAILPVPHMPIYHYGEIAPPSYRALWAHNFARLQAGQEPVGALPPDAPRWDYIWRIPFAGPQPLDPLAVGARAPFCEEDYR